MTDSNWPDDFIAKYPLTFRDPRSGFSCQEGWRELLTELCTVIEPIIAAMPDGQRAYAMQVKEKFGALRFYMSGSVPAIDAAIDAAEARSLETCEICGAPGQRGSNSTHGWVTVRCATCRGPHSAGPSRTLP